MSNCIKGTVLGLSYYLIYLAIKKLGSKWPRGITRPTLESHSAIRHLRSEKETGSS